MNDIRLLNQEFIKLGILCTEKEYMGYGHMIPNLEEKLEALPGDGNWHEESVWKHTYNTIMSTIDLVKEYNEEYNSYPYCKGVENIARSPIMRFMRLVALYHDIGKLYVEKPYYKDHAEESVKVIIDQIVPQTSPLCEYLIWYIRNHHAALRAIRINGYNKRREFWESITKCNPNQNVCHPSLLVLFAIADLMGTTSDKNKKKREEMIKELRSELRAVEGFNSYA
jgi:hypothetical protein